MKQKHLMLALLPAAMLLAGCAGGTPTASTGTSAEEETTESTVNTGKWDDVSLAAFDEYLNGFVMPYIDGFDEADINVSYYAEYSCLSIEGGAMTDYSLVEDYSDALVNAGFELVGEDSGYSLYYYDEETHFELSVDLYAYSRDLFGFATEGDCYFVCDIYPSSVIYSDVFPSQDLASLIEEKWGYEGIELPSFDSDSYYLYLPDNVYSNFQIVGYVGVANDITSDYCDALLEKGYGELYSDDSGSAYLDPAGNVAVLPYMDEGYFSILVYRLTDILG